MSTMADKICGNVLENTNTNTKITQFKN